MWDTSHELDARHASHEPAAEHEPEHHAESARFSSAGAIPPVGDGFAAAAPSASEQAFDQVHTALGRHGLGGVEVTHGSAGAAAHAHQRPGKHGHAAPPMEMVTEGVEFTGATEVTGADGKAQVVATDTQKAAFAGAAKAGFTTLRYFIEDGQYGIWGENGPDYGVHHVEDQIQEISDDIKAARQLGYHFKYQVVLTPSRNSLDWKHAPTNHDPKQFGRFVSEVVGALSKLGVNRYSMCNEPNLPIFNNPDPKHYSLQRAAHNYRNLYDSGYAAAHRADQHAQVLFGELAGGSPNAEKFFQDVLNAKHQPILAEGFALHPYQHNSLPTQSPGHGKLGIGNLDETDRLLAEHRDQIHTKGGGELPVFLSEFGYFREPYGKSPAWPETPGQGHMTRQHAMIIALNNALKHHVREFTQYMFLHGPGGPVWDTGVASLDATGQAELDATGQAESNWIHQHRHSVA
jgi:hypothetical protein